jgi:hypothetical protein
MPEENVTRRRHALLVDVTQAAGEVSRLIHEAHALHLPVERARVRDGRDAWSAGRYCWRTCCPDPTPGQQ